MAEYENTTLQVKLVTVEMKQGMLEKYLGKLQGKSSLPVGIYYAEMLRAGAAVGWVTEPVWTNAEIADQDPRVIRWIGEHLNKLYTEITTVPPD